MLGDFGFWWDVGAPDFLDPGSTPLRLTVDKHGDAFVFILQEHTVSNMYGMT